MSQTPIHKFCLLDTPYDSKAAIIEEETGHITTYSDLRLRVLRFAYGLSQIGCRKGDVFGICSPNSLRWVIAFFGAMSVGATVTTVNPQYTHEELQHMLKESKARFLFGPSTLLRKLQKVNGTDLAHVIVYGNSDDSLRGKTVYDFDRFITRGIDKEAETLRHVNAVPCNVKRDVAVLPFSSGTTGLPKAVMLSHFNVTSAVAVYEKATPPDDVLYGILPFYHIYGQVAILEAALRAGATIVVKSQFDFASFLKAVEKYRITRLYLVPPIVLRLAKDPLALKHDFSSVKVIMSGAAPLGEAIEKKCVERFPRALLYQGYGMTENSALSHTLDPKGPEDIVSGSVGRVPSIMQCKVIDASGKVLGPDQPGEICVKGPNVMLGYLNRPEATKRTIVDGWLHTGDVGYFDKDGNYFVVDRIKELIKVKGFQVAPAELEALLLQHPAILDCAVIGIPSETSGEVPKAIVVLKPGYANTKKSEILRFVGGRVVKYKHIKALDFVKTIPKSASGKILRRHLRTKEREAYAMNLKAKL